MDRQCSAHLRNAADEMDRYVARFDVAAQSGTTHDGPSSLLSYAACHLASLSSNLRLDMAISHAVRWSQAQSELTRDE